MSAARVERLDHVAMVVADFDGTVSVFTEVLGLECIRIGSLNREPSRRIAMIGDGTGFKLELIEAPLDGGPASGAELDHVAVRVSDVTESHRALSASGFESRRSPVRVEAAEAETAVLLAPNGLTVQIIRYDPSSPDV
ncbi:MAG: VOC family protein [Acidimicrobiia bacterium]